MTEQEYKEEIYELKCKLRQNMEDHLFELSIYDFGGVIVLSIIMFLHLEWWIDKHVIVGMSQWLYIIPFFVCVAIALFGAFYLQVKRKKQIRQ